MNKQRGLGKGLSALLGDDVEPNDRDSSVLEVNINLIDTFQNQPRKHFDEAKLLELAASIRTHGIVSPIIVSSSGGRYTIVAGERRYRAARMAGLNTVPVIVKDLSSRGQIEISIIENLQREDLNAVEEAQAMKMLMDEYNLTQEEVSERIAKSRPAVANSLRLLTLPKEVLDMLVMGSISAGHARCLIPLPEDEMKITLAKHIAEKGLSVRESERMVSELLNPEEKKQAQKDTKKSATNPDITDIEKRLSRILETKVSMQGDMKKGKLVVEYYSTAQLETIYELITTHADEMIRRSQSMLTFVD